jgi:glycosyltransferase involved in cell wall biosynthesis
MRSVLLVCNLHPKKLGTFERYLVAFGHQARAAGARCGLLVSGEPIPAVAELLRDAGVEWWTVPDWNDYRDRERRGAFLRGYAGALRRGPWDAVVFQFCHELSVAVATALARLRRRAPQTAVWVQHSQMSPARWAARQFSRSRLLRPFVDAVIVLSDAGRDAVCTRGWPASRVTVVRNGIAITTDPRRHWLRSELGLPPDAVVLLSVGSLIERKGYDLLLTASAPHLGSAAGAPRFLLVVGEGSELGSLQARTETLGVSDFVRFLGLRNDVPDLLADADLFVLASRAEGLTLAVVEAMAAGLPVVVTDVGGHKEVVGPATGWIVPPNDATALGLALGEALADLPEARRRGAAGRLVAAGYSLEAQVEAQFRVLQTAGGGRREPTGHEGTS